MLDNYGREIDYLRISITDKCNLRCKYCMPEDIESLPMKEILSYEEILYIAETAAQLGIKKIKITGGEPLIRRGCCKLISMLKGIRGIWEVTITTNGVMLDDNISSLCEAGTDGINISIDTLDKDRYRQITGYDELERVLKGLENAVRSGIHVKVNAVSVGRAEGPGGFDMSDAYSLAELARDRAIDVRFIEMMPIGYGKDFPAIGHDVLIPALKKRYKGMTEDGSMHGNGPAVYYRIPGFKGSIGFISAVHGIFCSSCNRIRLTTQGYLKSCLCYDTGADLKSIIRSGLPEEEISNRLRSAIQNAILCKPRSHSFEDVKRISEKHVMSKIGG